MTEILATMADNWGLLGREHFRDYCCLYRRQRTSSSQQADISNDHRWLDVEFDLLRHDWRRLVHRIDVEPGWNCGWRRDAAARLCNWGDGRWRRENDGCHRCLGSLQHYVLCILRISDRWSDTGHHHGCCCWRRKEALQSVLFHP